MYVYEQGLNDYVVRMKQLNVAEADMIAENLRLNKDGAMKQWDSFVKRGDKLLASHTILGEEKQLLQWVKWMDKGCADMPLREKAAQWCEKVYGDLAKKNEEIKKRLRPGEILAISMIDYKTELVRIAEKLRKPMEHN